MANNHRVSWALSAEQDLERIIHFVSLESPQTALKLLKKFRSKAATLKKNSGRGRKLLELTHLPELPFRELLMPPWRLIYQIKPRQVNIIALFDSRRDLEEILFERLTRFP